MKPMRRFWVTWIVLWGFLLGCGRLPNQATPLPAEAQVQTLVVQVYAALSQTATVATPANSPQVLRPSTNGYTQRLPSPTPVAPFLTSRPPSATPSGTNPEPTIAPSSTGAMQPTPSPSAPSRTFTATPQPPRPTPSPSAPPPTFTATPQPPQPTPSPSAPPPTFTATPQPPQPTPTSTACVPPPNPSYEQQVIDLINQERQNAGLPALQAQASFTVAARAHTTDMICNDFFSHTGSDGSQPWDRASRYGYAWSWIGENLFMGSGLTPASVVQGWMNSSGHRANILSAQAVHIGVGYMYDAAEGAWYVTALFGHPR